MMCYITLHVIDGYLLHVALNVREGERIFEQRVLYIDFE
jgi:hypothetical protein